MAYIKTQRRASGGGGTGVFLRSKWQLFEIEDPYTSGDLIGLLDHTPYYGQDGMIVWFQGNESDPFADWVYDAPNQFHFQFNFDPATDYPETGIVRVLVWYQYEV